MSKTKRVIRIVLLGIWLVVPTELLCCFFSLAALDVMLFTPTAHVFIALLTIATYDALFFVAIVLWLAFGAAALCTGRYRRAHIYAMSLLALDLAICLFDQLQIIPMIMDMAIILAINSVDKKVRGIDFA